MKTQVLAKDLQVGDVIHATGDAAVITSILTNRDKRTWFMAEGAEGERMHSRRLQKLTWVDRT